MTGTLSSKFMTDRGCLALAVTAHEPRLVDELAGSYLSHATAATSDFRTPSSRRASAYFWP